MYYLLGALVALVLFVFSRGVSVRTSGANPRITKGLAEHLQEELLVLERIAIAAARESSGKVLDHSDQSIKVVEDLIYLDSNFSSLSQEDRSQQVLALGSYVGEVLVRTLDGQWRIEELSHPLPFIVFPNGIRASPFDLVSSQFASPERTLETAYANLITVVSELPGPIIDGVQASDAPIQLNIPDRETEGD